MNTFLDSIDTYDFLRDGWVKTSIGKPLADFLTRKVGAASFIDLPSDHCDAGPRQRADFIEGDALSVILRNLWRSIIKDDLSSLAAHYRTGAEPSVITALRLGTGYSLDWHNHLYSKCTATLLIYLFEGDDAGEGGDLVLGELGRDMKNIHETKRFSIKHGDAILIGDASHPLLMHKADRWESRGAGSRILLSFAFNADDW
jgi:hypothetical protein